MNTYNIVLVNTWRMTNAKGGTEKVLNYMANTLCEKGHNVYVLFYDQNKGTLGFDYKNSVYLINCFIKKTSWLKRIGCFRFNKKIWNLNRKKLQARTIASTFQKEISKIPRPDLYISFTPEGTYILRELLEIHTPLVTMFHFEPNFFFQQDSFKYLYHNAVESSNAIQVLLPEFKKITQQEFPRSYVIDIPNVVPQYAIQAHYKNHKIICVGRICPHKRQLLLLESFIEIRQKFPDWTLEFWGEKHLDKNYTEHLERIISKFNLQQHVHLCGTTDNIEKKLINASIFVLPSISEAFSLALTEAMSVGLPIIGTKNCSFVNSIIRNNHNGILCNDTISDMSKALDCLMANESKRVHLGKNARIAVQSFSAISVWKQWENLINRLID